MLLSIRAAFFITFISFVLIFSAACSSSPAGSDTNTYPLSQNDNIPFSTREPERYTAMFIITSGDYTRQISVARDGLKHRYDYDFGAKNQVSSLYNGQRFVMLPDQRIYIEERTSAGPTGSAPDDPLTSSLLHKKLYTEFEELGTENNLTKYRAKIDGSDASSAVIYLDKAIGMPVKQEFYSIENGKETLQYAMEVRNFTTNVDASVFDVPEGFRKVSAEEFQARLRRAQ